MKTFNRQNIFSRRKILSILVVAVMLLSFTTSASSSLLNPYVEDFESGDFGAGTYVYDDLYGDGGMDVIPNSSLSGSYLLRLTFNDTYQSQRSLYFERTPVSEYQSTWSYSIEGRVKQLSQYESALITFSSTPPTATSLPSETEFQLASNTVELDSADPNSCETVYINPYNSWTLQPGDYFNLSVEVQPGGLETYTFYGEGDGFATETYNCINESAMVGSYIYLGSYYNGNPQDVYLDEFQYDVEEVFAGDGTQSSPYLINTPEKFNNMELNNSNVYYEQTADISFQGENISLVEFGDNFHYNGNGYTISDVDRAIGSNDQGGSALFTATDADGSQNVTIRNLNVENVTLQNSAVGTESYSYPAVLVSQLTSADGATGDIRNIKIIDSHISGSDESANAGVLASFNTNFYPDPDYTNVAVINSSTSSGGHCLGQMGTVENFYVDGCTTSQDLLSPTNGFNNASYGYVTDTDSGITSFGASTLNYVYKDINRTFLTDNDTINLTTDEMTGSAAETNMNFDFVNDWASTLEYPLLLGSLPDSFYTTEILSTNSPVNETDTLQVKTRFLQETDGVTTARFFVDGVQQDSVPVSSSKNVTFNYTTQIGDRGTHNFRVSTTHTFADGTFTVEVSPDYRYPVVQSTQPGNNTEVRFGEGQGFTFKANATIQNSTQPTFAEIQVRPEGSGSFSTQRSIQVNQSGTYDLTYTYSSAQYSGENFHDWRVYVYDEDSEGNTLEENYSSIKRYNTTEVIIPKYDTTSITPLPVNNVDNENYDVFFNGTVGTFDIQTASVELYHGGSLNQSVTVGSEIQNGSTFSYNQANAFQFYEDFAGDNLNFEFVIEDVEGYNNTATVSSIQADKPVFNFENPADERLFLTENDVDVQFDYGGQTEEDGDWVLVVNGFVEDTTGDLAGSNSEGIHTITYTPPVEAIWEIHFDSTTTGRTYTSDDFRTFYVRETPVDIQLKNPSAGTTYNVNFSETVDINFTFDAAAGGFTGDYYYRFQVRDDETNAFLVNRTSTVKGGGDTASYKEQVQNIGEGRYSWIVQAYKDSDDQLVDTEQRTFKVLEPGIFDVTINSPDEGDLFRTPLDSNVTDVNTTYTVSVESENVTTDLYVDGVQKQERQFSAGSGNHTFTYTMQDLTEQQHTVNITGTDESGRLKWQAVNFEVAEDDEPPTITEFRSTPNLRDAEAGDTLDLYFYGVEGSDEIDFVNVTVYVNGSVEKYEVVPAEELVEGSFQKELLNFVTIPSTAVGLPIYVQIDAVDVAGRVGTFISNTFTLQSNKPAAELVRPSDGYSYEQTPGSVENILLEFDVYPNDNNNYFNLWMKPEGAPAFTLIDGGVNVTGNTGDSESFDRFVNLDSTFGQQFGEFEWYVEVYDAAEDKFYPTKHRTFSVIEEQTAPVLSILNPEANDVIYVPRDVKSGEVRLRAEVKDSPESGDVKMSLNGRTVHETGVNTGTTTVNKRVNLSTGVYDYKVTFKSDSYTVTQERTFEVALNPPNNNTIYLGQPRDGETLYQDIGSRFNWNLWANQTGTTTAYIVNSTGGVVRNFSQSYRRVGSQAVYTGFFNASVPTGNYKWWAEATLEDNTSLRTENRSFTVLNYQAPEISDVPAPANNSVIQQGDLTNFSFTSQTYEQAAQVSLHVRPVGEYDTEVLLNVSQNSNTQRTLEASKEYSPGRYAWYVQWDTNPTFTTSERIFTVESTSQNPPDISADSPQQNDTFTISVNKTAVNVTFDYAVEVYTESDSTVKLLLASETDGLDNFTTIRQTSQNTDDGLVSYSHVEELGEDGYFWKVRVRYPNGTTYESGEIGFAVGNATAPQPTQPPVEDGGWGGIIGNFFVSVSGNITTAFSGLGAGALFVVASLLTGLAGVMVSMWTDHSEVGLVAMIVAALTFVRLGWYQPWVGIIIFLVASGVFIFALRKIHGGE